MPRFLEVLHGFLQGEWASDPAGFSYLRFAHATGWVTPSNVSAWKQERLPAQWRTSAPSAWLHESEYAALAFSRPTFSKQLTISLHALKTALGRVGSPVTIRNCKALQHVGHSQPVMAGSAVPNKCIPLVDDLLQNLLSVSFSAACRRRVEPLCQSRERVPTSAATAAGCLEFLL